jgi:hypothetical protein
MDEVQNMASKNMAVFGLYPSRTAAEEAMGHLLSAGFRNTDASVLVPENQGTKDLAHEKHTKAPEGLATGVILGGIVGGVLGWLIATGVLAIPQLAPYIASGPIVAALAGAAAVGVLAGIIGALVGLSIPEYEAKRFEGRIRDGGILLSVHCDNNEWTKRAKTVLVDTGAQDIGAAGEKSGDFANADKPLPRVRTVVDPAIVPSTDVYAGRLQPRVTAPPADSVVTGDELYTERLVRRQKVQDPQNIE